MKLYSASSLEDIAVMFDRSAESDERQAKATKAKRVGAVYAARANTWRTAANILRDTELVAA